MNRVFIALIAMSCMFCAKGLAMEPKFELTVLGIAQDGGAPHVGCFETCCSRLRESGESLGAACLGVRDLETGQLLLVEATPHIESQLAWWYRDLGITRTKASPVDAVFLTHAHIGHYLGLAQLGREVAGSRGVEVYATPAMGEFLEGNAPWSQLISLDQITLVPTPLGESYSPLPGLTVTPIRVPHRDEFSDTVALRLKGPARTILFVPDVDNWAKHAGLLDSLLEDVDVAYLDGTFWDGTELPHRDPSEVPHPPMTLTMERLQEQAARNPERIRFIHLNHSNPALYVDAIRKSVKDRGFSVARVGEKIQF